MKKYIVAGLLVIAAVANLANPPAGDAALAERALFIASPNPRVGCVIGLPASQGAAVLGRGFTQHAGGAHAEVAALREASLRAVALHAPVTAPPVGSDEPALCGKKYMVPVFDPAAGETRAVQDSGRAGRASGASGRWPS